jgi:hypothetical protein
MFARRSRSSEAALRLLRTIIGWPRAFKYIIFSGTSPINKEGQGIGGNGIGRTKLPFAIFPEHPMLILELKGISEKWKTLWTGWNFAPWAR